MRSAMGKDFVREISHTRSRFLSILVLVALSVAFLSGLRSTAPDMKRTGDQYLDEQHLADIQVLSNLGLTDDDLAALLAQPEIESGEAAYVIDAYASSPESELVAKVYSLSEKDINNVVLRSGRMPETSGECVVEDALLSELGLALGDTVMLRPGSAMADALRRDSFTVVGTVRSPIYVSIERGASTLGSGTVKAYCYLPRSAFALDYYTAIYLRVRGAAEKTAFYPEYDDSIDALIEELEPLGRERARIRYDAIVDEANEKVDEAREELDKARAEAEEQLAEAKTELDDARAELDRGWSELRDAERTLARESEEAQAQLDDARRELEEALQKLTDGEEEYRRGLAEYRDGYVKYQQGLAEFRRGLAEYEAGRAEYERGLAQYEDGLAEYEAGARQLREAASQLRSAERELEEGKAKLERNEELLNAMTTVLFGQSREAFFAGLQDGSISAAEVDERLNTARELLDVAIEEGQKLLDAIDEEDEASLRERVEELLAELPEVPDELREMIDSLPSKARLQQLLNTAREKRGELDGINAAYLLSAKAQLDDGWRQYHEGVARVQEGWREYEDGAAELARAKRQLAAAEAELDEARAQLDDAKREIDRGQAELDEAKARLDDAKAQLDDARAELDRGRKEYEDGVAAVADGERELSERIADAKRELSDGRRKLNDGEAEYRDGYAQYLDGKREAEEKLADGERKLRDARRRISEIEHGTWYILSRSYNPGYTGFGQDADRMGNLASVFPLIFFLVAALVCLTTMTRMVEEQRIQIGSLKALGYSRPAISVKYIGYGLLPSLLGSILGLGIGYTLFPTMIFTAYQIMYQVPNIKLYAYPDISAFSVVAAVACTTVATLWACLATLRETPANLMRPRTPKAGKRVFLEYIRPLWRRMKFIHKVTARNLFRYQKRFWMTVIGIGGCTALIIAGFGLRSSLMFTMSRQFDELFHYTAQVAFLDSILPEDRVAVEEFIETDKRISERVPCTISTATASAPHYSTSVYFEVLKSEDLPTAVELYDYHSGAVLTMTDEGVYIDQKLSELLHVGVGDTFLLDGDRRAEVTVAGIFEHYTAHFVYMTPAYYETVFGEKPETNGYLLQLTNDEPAFCDAVFEELMDRGSVSATRMTDTRDTYLHSMERIDFVVVIVILAAAALAMVVLYNLSNINITERLRELATIKLLGFYDTEVSAYVYRENIVLTVIGILAGIVMGHWLHVWLVRSVEIDLMMFGRETDPKSYLYAALLTALFSFLVNLVAHFKMKKINMVESLKSAE